jgi:hypothetical protein
MSDDNTPRPMANMLSAAREGQLAVDMNAEDFVYIDRDCNFFKDAIRDIQTTVADIARAERWGLGEKSEGMVSASTVVERFRTKANGAPDGNSVYQILEDHYRIVEDIQETYRIVRDRMMQADSDFAAEFSRLDTELPERPPVQLPYAPTYLSVGAGK